MYRFLAPIKSQLSKVTLNTFVQDLLAITVLIGFSWFLISYYTSGDFLNTGYQDWIYHAFRLRTIQADGLQSWDPIWSNGLNIWRSYQYVIYYVLLGIESFLKIGIPRLMMTSIIAVFILTRIAWYVVLRYCSVRPLIAFLGSLSTFYILQQWASIKDFSIFIASLYLPLFTLVWIRSTTRQRSLVLSSAMSGFAWFLHPILGIICSGMWGMMLLFSLTKLPLKTKILNFLVFGLIFAGFAIPYFFYGYGFSHPIFSTIDFLNTSLQRPGFLGLSRFILFCLGMSWIILILKVSTIQKWAKILTLFVTLYLLTIVAAINNFLPPTVLQLQFGRGAFMIGFLICLLFANGLEQLIGQSRNKLWLTIVAVLSAIIMVESITWAADLAAPPTNTLISPVTTFLTTTKPVGSIFFRQPSFPSYFSFDQVKFPNSYNWHLEPHPYSYRYTQLLASDYSFTRVAPSTISLINAYTQVLGVQYLFLPTQSALARDIEKQASPSAYKKVSELEDELLSYSVLESPFKPTQAYILNSASNQAVLNTTQLPTPTLKVSSFKIWDEAIEALHTELLSQNASPLQLEIPSKTELKIKLPTVTENSTLLILQSYDPYWKVTGLSQPADPTPTTTRFLQLPISASDSNRAISLKHSWPAWFWPTQFMAFTTFVLTILLVLFSVAGEFFQGLKGKHE